jgi:glycosyltransferase involved in cell wall biosynthesis
MIRVAGVTMPGAFSGADNALFRGIADSAALVDVVHGDLPTSAKYRFLATSVRWPKNAWYFAWQQKMTKSAAAFRARTSIVDRRLRACLNSYDIVLQAGGLHAPFHGEFPKPVVMFCDYTTKLAERNWQPWFGLSPRDAAAWYELETAFYRKCAMICPSSSNTKRSLVQDFGVPESRVRVIGAGVDAVHAPAERKRYDERTVLFIGIDFERKGGATLLEAMRRVRAGIPDARLLIVGPNARTDEPGISWLGHVSSRETVHRLLAEATVLALPALCEPFGLVVTEAMSHGLPVVASNTDAIPEIVEDGRTGYLVERGDAPALADRLASVLASPEQARAMGQAGLKRVRERFMWSQVCQRLYDGLREVQQSTAAHRPAYTTANMRVAHWMQPM